MGIQEDVSVLSICLDKEVMGWGSLTASRRILLLLFLALW